MKRTLSALYQYFPALLSGFALTLSFPKAEISWLAWFAIVPFILSLHGMEHKKAFRAGFLMGLAHFLSLIYWIVPTINIYGQLPLLLALPILMLLACYLALYPALFASGLNYLTDMNQLSEYGSRYTKIEASHISDIGSKKEKPVARRIRNFSRVLLPFTASALWVALEYLRSILFTGFPWGLAGYSQYGHLQLIQIADITSVYGVSFLIIFTNTVIAIMIKELNPAQKKPDSWRISAIWALITLVIFASVLLYGRVRMDHVRQIADNSDKKTLSVIQGNIEQVLKWDEAYQEDTIKKYCSLSIDAAVEKPDLIVWPETAMPFYYKWNKKMSAEVNECIKYAQTTFLIGSPAFRTIDSKAKSYSFFNRAYMVKSDGEITGSYDKVHLVPFGEYVPFGKYLSFLGKIIAQAGDFSSGKRGAPPLEFSNSKAGILICFEVIFPYLSREAAENGANVLITMTNDAWFGYTSAPRQHFTMAVFRAIENRRAVARAANTGISGFIGPDGEIIATTGLFESCSLTRTIPALTIKTFYTSYGDIFSLICLFAICCAFMVNIRSKKRS